MEPRRPQGNVARASVVIPTRNRGRSLGRLLGSLDRLYPTVPEEVIVVDGGSSDTTRSVLQDWAAANHLFTTRMISQSGGLGPGQGRNLGMEAAVGEIVAFIDDDCIASPNWLGDLITGVDLEEGFIGAGGAVEPLANDLVSMFYTYYRVLEPPSSLPYLVTANCAFARAPVLELGGFNRRISKPGGEDIALGLRLRAAGWRFRFVPGATVLHDFRPSPIDVMTTFRNYGKGCFEAAGPLLDARIRT